MPRSAVLPLFLVFRTCCAARKMTIFLPGTGYTQGMDVIYADSLFLINGVINYLILLLTGRVCSLPLRRRRFVLGAALGGVYAVFAAIPGIGFLRSGAVKLSVGVMMCLLAFGYSQRLWRCIIGFMAVSAAFGGAVYAAAMFAGADVSGSGIPVSARTLLISFAVCYAAISAVFQRTGQRVRRRVLSIEITLGGKKAALRALSDSGNELRDPYSGLRVIAADIAPLAVLFPDGAVDFLFTGGAAGFIERMSHEALLAGRLSLIPFRAVGTDGGLLAAFRPDSIVIDGRESSDYIVALSPSPLSSDGDYSAVFQEV